MLQCVLLHILVLLILCVKGRSSRTEQIIRDENNHGSWLQNMRDIYCSIGTTAVRERVIPNERKYRDWLPKLTVRG